MNIKKVLCRITIIVLTVAVTALVLRFIVFGKTVPTAADAVDKRTVILVTEEERGFILNEMRTFLSGTQGILQAVLNQDIEDVALVARSLGINIVHDIPKGLIGKLPLSFKKLGMGVHNDFDRLALDAEDLEDFDQILEQLNQILISCVECHYAYRLETELAISNQVER